MCPQLPDLSLLVSLEKLDLSINQLRSMAPLSTLRASALKEVYITSNKVSTIEVCLATDAIFEFMCIECSAVNKHIGNNACNTFCGRQQTQPCLK